MSREALLFSTRNSLKLSNEIAFFHKSILGGIQFFKFSDGEYELSFKESIRSKQVFLIGSTFPPADNLMELLLMCDSAKRSSANNITLIIPYFGWARQDRKYKPRSSISAKLVANLIEASGADRVISLDLHTDQIQGFFDIPVDNLSSSSIFIKYIDNLKLSDLIIASPDMGGAKRARNYAEYFKTDIVICYKERKMANEIEYMNLIGNVKNKNVILVDDIVDTAGTLVKAANIIKKEGASSIRAIATHALLSGNAIKEIELSSIEELITTNTIPINKKNSYNEKIKFLSSAPLLAEVIDLIHKKKSISHKFII